jgi:hypothetical protein
LRLLVRSVLERQVFSERICADYESFNITERVLDQDLGHLEPRIVVESIYPALHRIEQSIEIVANIAQSGYYEASIIGPLVGYLDHAAATLLVGFGGARLRSLASTRSVASAQRLSPVSLGHGARTACLGSEGNRGALNAPANSAHAASSRAL